MHKLQLPRRTVIFLAFIYTNLFLTPALAQQPAADAVVGIWQADDGTVKLDMYKNGAEVQARLLYGNELVEADNVTFKKDTKNPDPAMRSRSMKNVVFIWGLRWDGSQWTGGSLYNGSSGRTLQLPSSGQGRQAAPEGISRNTTDGTNESVPSRSHLAHDGDTRRNGAFRYPSIALATSVPSRHALTQCKGAPSQRQ